MMRVVLPLLLLLASTLPAAATGPVLHLAGETMGTTWSVQVARPASHLDSRTLRHELATVVADVDQRMSTYRPDSEISRFNARRTRAWIPVSRDTRRVVAEALRVSRLSAGAFDPTVAPLLDLWGFGAAGGAGDLPRPATLRATRARVGWRALDVAEGVVALRKRRPDLEIDLSAIAKGFGIDAMAEHLERRGVTDYLIEIGGELRGRGRGRHGTGWTVGIELPHDASAVAAVVRLERAAVATSGDYRKGAEVGGVRRPHVLDPRTGSPVRHALASATVVARTAMRADALATALLVLGPDDGWELARRERLAALLVIRTSDGFEIRRTPDLSGHLLAGGGAS
jgi:thiamine biosynthesis lipoprotein